MKSIAVWLAFGLICTVPGALVRAADADEHAGHHPAASAPEDATTAAHDHGADKADPLQASMLRIEGLMTQIQETTDAERKQALLAEHLQAMRDQVMALRAPGRTMKAAMKAGEKMGGDRKEGDAMSGMMKPGEKKEGDAMGGMMKPGMMKMHEKMEQRVDMLERLLQQALEREAAKGSSAP